MTNHKKLSNDAPIEASARAQQSSPKLRILQAARELFFSKGVAAVTTDMLVKRAKTSKMTLYKYFANKDEILEQVVSDDVSRIFEPLNTNIDTLDDYTQVVINFCQNLVDIIFDPEIVRFDQLMISQALSHQELTQIHYNRTYQPTIDRVQQLLELGQRKGYISGKFSSVLLTDILVSSISGLGYTRAIHGFDDSKAYSAKEIRDIVEVLLGLRSCDDDY
jgi:AcrR family transcriptional regulator